MLHRWNHSTSFVPAVLLLSLFLCMSACSGRTEVVQDPSDHFADANEMVVYETDSTEWRVQLFAQHLLYSKAVEVQLPSPWLIPTREDAVILKTCTYPHDERFITSDGYTFGMPSASVSKAGQKTKYSVLGLWKRKTVIVIDF